MLVEINEGMSELLDNQVHTQNPKSESKTSGVHASPRKVCTQNYMQDDCHSKLF